MSAKKWSGGSASVTQMGTVRVAAAAEQYLQHLVVERGLAANTVQSYRRDLRRYDGYLAGRGKASLADVGPRDVAEFLATLREGDDEHLPLAASSAGRAVIAVRGMHAFAARSGLAVSDPAREVSAARPAQAAAQGHLGRAGGAPARRGGRDDRPGTSRAAGPGAA